MHSELSPSAQKVQQALAGHGLPCEVVELAASTRTAVDAAAAVGCEVAQIVKSLVLRTTGSNRAIMVVASGVNRLNLKALQRLVGEPIKMADADFVRTQTGFAIGGVPPLGHTTPLPTYIDEDLMKHAVIYAAAGTPHAVFRLAPGDLKKITSGEIVTIK